MLQVGLISMLIISMTLLIIKRIAGYVTILQQQQYSSFKFITWIISNQAIDKQVSVGLIVIFTVNYLIFKLLNIPWYKSLSSTPQYLAFTAIILLFNNLPKLYQLLKPNPTITIKRFNRVYYLSLIIALLNNLFLLYSINLYNYLVILLLAVHLIPIYVIAANTLLLPIEKFVSKYTQNNCL